MADEGPRHVALVGMMAVGKTTTGRALAERLGARFVDTDEVIETRTGRTPRRLWEEGGEDAYRPLEREAVAEALAAADPVVLAVPGGVAVDDAMATLVLAPTSPPSTSGPPWRPSCATSAPTPATGRCSAPTRPPPWPVC